MPDREKIINSLKYFSRLNDPKIDWQKVDLDSIVLLDHARDTAGVPFIITSNYRTPEHSLEVGGLKADAHSEENCTAFDILCKRTNGTWDSQAAYKIVGALYQVGFTRIGVGKNHIHCDRSIKLPQQVLWLE